MMYILAALTGFRRRGLSSLALRSSDFDADPATATVEASHAKNRRRDTQPLHQTVVKRMRGCLQSKEGYDADNPLFPLVTPGGWWRKTGKMMREDLTRAREQWIEEAREDPSERAKRERSDNLTYRNEDGFYVDFHAHRHAFISNLGKAGVPLATAQKLARHSNPKLYRSRSSVTHFTQTRNASEESTCRPRLRSLKFLAVPFAGKWP